MNWLAQPLNSFTFPATGAAVAALVIDGSTWLVAYEVTSLLGFTGSQGRRAVLALDPKDRRHANLGERIGSHGNPMRQVVRIRGAYQEWMAAEAARVGSAVPV